MNREFIDSVLDSFWTVSGRLKYNDINLKFNYINNINHIILKILKTLDSELVQAGEHRLQQWENGWKENYDELVKSGDINSIIPKYYSKYPVLRVNQQFIEPLSENFERNSLYIIEDWLLNKYAKDFENIYEFGCGSCHNLLRIRKANKNANIYGLDWSVSSQKITKYINEHFDNKIFGYNFDFFNPPKEYSESITNYSYNILGNSMIYTVAALEQIGDKHNIFIDYLLDKKPDLCVHIEPIAEVLDENNLLDYLSLKYFKKRNYLSGFLTKLRELEIENKIEIIDIQRSYIGSLYIDGYTIVVWKIKK